MYIIVYIYICIYIYIFAHGMVDNQSVRRMQAPTVAGPGSDWPVCRRVAASAPKRPAGKCHAFCAARLCWQPMPAVGQLVGVR